MLFRWSEIWFHNLFQINKTSLIVYLTLSAPSTASRKNKKPYWQLYDCRFEEISIHTGLCLNVVCWSPDDSNQCYLASLAWNPDISVLHFLHEMKVKNPWKFKISISDSWPESRTEMNGFKTFKKCNILHPSRGQKY